MPLAAAYLIAVLGWGSGQAAGSGQGQGQGQGSGRGKAYRVKTPSLPPTGGRGTPGQAHWSAVSCQGAGSGWGAQS